MTLGIFQMEVKKQSSCALTSVSYINSCLVSLGEQGKGEQLWYFVQSFLNSSANVSKLLWGSNKFQNPKRKELRESLNVSDDYVLFCRDLRNDFDHYDERIETWSESSKRKSYVDSNIGSTDMIAGVEKDDYLRNFDTEKMAITFKGTDYELQPIINELVQLNERVTQVLEKRW